MKMEITALILASILLGSITAVQSSFAEVRMKDTTESTDKKLTNDISIIIPLYISPNTSASGPYPSQAWNDTMNFAQAHPKVSIYAIINPYCGTGVSKDHPFGGADYYNYTKGVADLQSKGITVLGYVYTSAGVRPLNSTTTYNSNPFSPSDPNFCGLPFPVKITGVYGNITAYKNWYNVDGIFLDEMEDHELGDVAYYKSITDYTKSLGMKTVIGNPGKDVESEFVGSVDKIIIREGAGMPNTSQLAGDGLGTTESAGWHSHYSKSNFGYYAYSVGSSGFTESQLSDYVKYVSTFYVTNAGGWNTLSNYLANMSKVIEPLVPTGDKARSSAFEYVSDASSLKGKSIDTIKLKLAKTGSPSGNYVVGVFNATTGTIKKVFANNTASSLSTSFTEMAFDNSTTYMNVGTSSPSWALYAGTTTIWAEYVNDTSSALKGKTVDTIKISLQRTGSPPGVVKFGVWNSTGQLQHVFGNVTAMAISTSQSDVTVRGSPYTLKQGDGIGVTYASGDVNNYIRGFDDSTNPFDSTHSYRERWDTTTGSWVRIATGNDVRMTLSDHPSHPGIPYTLVKDDAIGIQYTKGDKDNYISVKVDTNASDPFDGSNSKYMELTEPASIDSTSDLTATVSQTGNVYYDNVVNFSTALNDVNKANAEHITSTATNLIGEKINEMTVRLKKTGSPTGTVYIGVLDSSNNVVQQFGTIDASTVSTSATDYTFTLSGPTTYTIASDDRIGVKYMSGTSSNYIEVYRDQDGDPEPFGRDAYREYYTTGWQLFGGNDYDQDLYMVLKLTGQ